VLLLLMLVAQVMVIFPLAVRRTASAHSACARWAGLYVARAEASQAPR
jgi:hypothetical protein